jgi:hypothetical protein
MHAQSNLSLPHETASISLFHSHLNERRLDALSDVVDAPGERLAGPRSVQHKTKTNGRGIHEIDQSVIIKNWNQHFVNHGKPQKLTNGC